MFREFWGILRFIGDFSAAAIEGTTMIFNKTRIYSSIQSIWGQSRSRKLCFLLLFGIVIVFYTWQSIVYPKLFSKLPIDRLQGCTEDLLHRYTVNLREKDAVAFHTPLSPGEGSIFPFVGNGKIGVSTSSSSALYIRNGRTLSLRVDYYPLVHFSVEKVHHRDLTVLDFLNGEVTKKQCFETQDETTYWASVTHNIYAHRRRPSVLVQDVRIHNPTRTPVVLQVEKILVSGWKDAVTKSIKGSYKGQELNYSLTTGTVGVEDEKVIVVSIASRRLPDNVDVAPGHTETYHLVTIVHYSEPVARDHAHISKVTAETHLKVQEDLSTVLNFEERHLVKDHIDTWNKLWLTGFNISPSLAPGALNGERINATRYWCLSHVPAPLHDIPPPHDKTPAKQREEELGKLRQVLNYAESCYGGVHTLTASSLWVEVTGEASMVKLVNHWLTTIEKHGCRNMLKAGADGVAQAMVLSFGLLKFTNDHLEFNMHPSDLHRDFHFRRVQYGNETHVNISVRVGEDNKAVLHVSLDRNDRPYYACDAGCLDPPAKLDKTWKSLPVKLTEPKTAILYITSDLRHMEELKHGLPISHVVEAPAHEQHVMVLHRHGHRWGGLPPIFWIALIALVVCFHFFLFRLIYNEYFRDSQDYGRRYVARL